MSITTDQIRGVIVEQLNRDQVLSELNQVTQKLGISADQALKVATIVAQYAAARGGDKSQIIAYATDAYKATVYQQVAKAGQRYSDGRDTNLTNAWTKVSEILVQMRKAQENSLGGNAGGLLGGNSGGGGIPVSSGLTLAADTGGIKVGNSSGGISVAAPSTDIDLVNDPMLSAPAQPATPQPAPAAPQAAVEPLQPAAVLPFTINANNPINDPLASAISENGRYRRVNDPVNNILQEIDVEEYKYHELESPEAKMSIPAKEANTRIKQSVFAETRDWAGPLQDIFNGKEEVVYYVGADLVVRARDSYRAYLVGVKEDMVEKVKAFVAQHDALKADLENLAEVDDVEKLISRVQAVLSGMRKNATELHDFAFEQSEEPEVIISEVARFANAYMANITLLVHNALSLGTNRCTEVPTISGGLELERAPDDIEFFAKDLFAASAGANGVSEYEDWFRDLFLMVATSLRKLTIKPSDSFSTISLIQSMITIVIPGLYQSVDKHDVVTVASLGNSADPIVSIYEAIQSNCPHTQVMLQVPQRTYLLLSNGELTAPVHY